MEPWFRLILSAGAIAMHYQRSITLHELYAYRHINEAGVGTRGQAAVTHGFICLLSSLIY